MRKRPDPPQDPVIAWMAPSGAAWDASAKLLRHRYPALHPEEARHVADLHRLAVRSFRKGSAMRARHEAEIGKVLAKLKGPRSYEEAVAAFYSPKPAVVHKPEPRGGGLAGVGAALAAGIASPTGVVLIVVIAGLIVYANREAIAGWWRGIRARQP